MTSLPIPTWPDSAPAVMPRLAQGPRTKTGPQDEIALLQAFRSFAKVAGSLERSYGQLQAEVERLRGELAEREGDLASSVEERLNERARQGAIFEGLPCGVLVTFDNGKIWKANPEVLRLIEAVRCGHALDSVSDLPPSLPPFLASVRSEGGEREIELALRDGTTRWLAARHASFADSMTVFILRDITEHKRLAETEVRLHRERALAEMSAILAHEVRNPLASLELFAGLLADSGLEAEKRQWIDHVQAGLRTLAATVNNVLDFHSAPHRQFSAVNLAQLLEWVVSFCSPLAHLSGITLSQQVGATEAIFRGDRHGLEQVLLNLVLNSIKAMPNGGRIEISARRLANSKEIELAVADNGPGIPAASLPKIFDPGFSTRAGGPGLGLAVCRKIAEQHGGTIRAESSPQRGTRVRLTLPWVSEEEASA